MRNTIIIFILTIIICFPNCKSGNNNSTKNYVNLFLDDSIISNQNFIPIDTFSNFIIVKSDNLYGLIDKKNIMLLPFEYDYIEYQDLRNYFIISKNGFSGVVDEKGNLIIPFEYDTIALTWYEKNYYDGKEVFIASKSNKLGTIDWDNNIVLPFEYDGITDWVEYGPPCEYVKKNNLYGLVDYNGKIIIPVIYEKIYAFSVEEWKNDTTAIIKRFIDVKKDGKYGIINFRNEPIIPVIYDSLLVDFDFWSYKDKKPNRFIVKSNDIWICFDENGNEIATNKQLKGLTDNYCKLDLNDEGYSYIDSCMIFVKNE